MWSLQVDHFSKYKLQENTSDDEGDQQQQKQQIQQLPSEMTKTSTAKVNVPELRILCIIDTYM